MSSKILRNTYIPRKTKKAKYDWYEHDLITYCDDLKYEEFGSDTDGCFKNAQVINVDVIHHVCRDKPLGNPEKYYKMIRSKEFNNYKQHVQSKAVSSAIKSERDDIHFENSVLKDHFQEKTMVGNALLSNGFFLKKKKNTTDFTKLKF